MRRGKMYNWVLGLVLIFLGGVQNVHGFCGFYVARASTELYNSASQVIIARQGERTILTMANDYKGEVKDFALVVPIPQVLPKEQIQVGDSEIFKRLDGFTAPRLVEYFDQDPCKPQIMMMEASKTMSTSRERTIDALGVAVEAQFAVGEYDIIILSAKESNGLETWLIQNQYQIPKGAPQVLEPYIEKGMKFFVAKVNLARYRQSEQSFLSPLQMAFESKNFMLPIQLGMLNAVGTQDLIIYFLSTKGRIETVNYPTKPIPSNIEIPIFVKNEFGAFYKALFQKAYESAPQPSVFLEYSWNTNWCDPCPAQPLTSEELRQSGRFWGNQDTFITRLHVRYTKEQFKEDLIFQETGNTQTFQGRYILRHPYKVRKIECENTKNYLKQLRQRQELQAQNLAGLTGWDVNSIQEKIEPVPGESEPWWQEVFKGSNQ